MQTHLLVPHPARPPIGVTAVEARWGVRYHEGHMSKLARGLGLSRQKARPSHPGADPAAREAFAKGGCRRPSTRRAPPIPASA